MSESKSVYVLNVVISLISPVRLAGEDRIKDILGIDKIPATMRALLAQEVIDRKILNPLATIKKRVRDTLLRYGTREPLLGWVVDPDRIDALVGAIRKCEKDFEQAKQALLSHYGASCAEHVEKLRQACHEEGMENIDVFLDVIRGSQPSEQYLRDQLRFRYLEPRAIELHEAEFEIILEGLFGQAVNDIARRAEEAQNALRYGTKVKALDEIEAKLRGLAYLDTRFGTIANQIDELVNELPVNLPHKEWDTRSEWALGGALDMLADPKRLVSRLEQEQSLFDVPLAAEPPQAERPKPAENPVVELFQTPEQPVDSESSATVADHSPDRAAISESPDTTRFVVDTVAW